MPRGKAHPPKLRATAVAAVAAGETAHVVAKRLGIAYQTVQRWCAEDGPVHAANARTREELSALVYDAVAETLRSLTARARVTGDPNWIAKQSASDLAELADTEWDRVIHMVAGFRTRTGPPALPAAAGPNGPDQDVEPASRADSDSG